MAGLPKLTGGHGDKAPPHPPLTGGFKGKAGSLGANEKTVTPKGALPHKPPRPTVVSKRLTANEKTVTPKGPLPSKAPPRRVSRTTYPATSGLGALVKATGGSYASDRPAMLRPEDVAALHHVSQHSPGVRMVGEILSDPTGLLTLGKSVAALSKHPSVGTGLGAGIAAAGILPFGKFGRLAKIAKEAEPLDDGAAKVAGKYVGSRHADIEGQIHDILHPNGNGLFPSTDFAGDVRASLKGAGKVRNQQNALYSVERTKRAGQMEHLYEQGIKNGLHPVEAHRLAFQALRGELPKLELGGVQLTHEHLPHLFDVIHQHPDLRPYERLRARGALLKVLDHQVPQHSEIKLLTKVFGENDVKALVKSTGLLKKLGNTAGEALNVPRAIMSSFDLSAPFRQGLVSGVSHPVIFARNFKPMLKAFKNEGNYQSIMDDIVSRPSYERMQKAGLGITDLDSGLSHREEQWFGENLAEKIPVAGHGVRASGRAYVGFLNKMRADVFDSLLAAAEKSGRDTNDEKMLHDIAKAVNSATGRGSGPKAIQSWLPALNTIFFSPRLLFSRLDYLNPVNYTRLDPIARKEYLKGSAGLVTTVGTVLMLARLAGAKVNTDPRNADFAKIKLGNTRIDILGGFQQPIRLLTQLEQGKIVSSTTGNTLSLGPQGPGHLSRKDIAQRFLESKLAPVPSFVNDVAKGTQFSGQKLDWGLNWNNPAFQRMVPLLLQDAKDVYKNQGGGAKGIGAAAGTYGLGAFGLGFQTYGPKKPGKPQPPNGSFLRSHGISDQTIAQLNALLNQTR